MRVSILDDPETGPQTRDTVAELLADGATRQAIADVFGVNKDTITEWRKRPDVQARVAKLQQDRANRILTGTDTRIAAKLEARNENGDLVPIPLRDLLEIRRTYAGNIVQVNPGDKAAAMGELLTALHEDPEAAAAVRSALGAADDDTGE